MMRRRTPILHAAALVLATSCSATYAAAALPFRIVATYPHDPTSWTEGLAIAGDVLLESDGLVGRSRVTEHRLRSGELIRSATLDAADYGEGVTVAGDRILQLTWKQQIGNIYDAGLSLVGRFHYAGEGWGLTFDGHAIIMSNGSATLRFFDPSDLSRTLRIVTVSDAGRQVQQLNELEYARGWIFANVWHDDRIAVIDPASGEVEAWCDLSALHATATHRAAAADVLNGIAYDPVTGHFFVTGKLWPYLFEIAIGEAPPAPR